MGVVSHVFPVVPPLAQTVLRLFSIHSVTTSNALDWKFALAVISHQLLLEYIP